MSKTTQTLFAAALLATAACAGASTAAPSDSVQLLIDGTAPEPLRLITAARYGIVEHPETGVVSSFLQESDTTRITLPFEGTYDISTYHIFLFRLTETEHALATVRMRAFVDGEEKLDQNANMQNGTFEWRWGL